VHDLARIVGRAGDALFVAAFFLDVVEVEGGAAVGDDALARHFRIVERADGTGQGAAGDDLALVVVQDVSTDAQALPRPDPRRIALADAAFLDDTGVVITVEVIAQLY